jgi:hypothetical protein
VIRFSTTSTTPSFVHTPIAVEPSCKHSERHFRICVSPGVIPTPPHLDGLKSILYLEQAPFRTKSVDTSVIFTPCEKHTARQQQRYAERAQSRVTGTAVLIVRCDASPTANGRMLVVRLNPQSNDACSITRAKTLSILA